MMQDKNLEKISNTCYKVNVGFDFWEEYSKEKCLQLSSLNPLIVESEPFLVSELIVK